MFFNFLEQAYFGQINTVFLKLWTTVKYVAHFLENIINDQHVTWK